MKKTFSTFLVICFGALLIFSSGASAQYPPMYLDKYPTHGHDADVAPFDDGNGAWASPWIDLFGMYFSDGVSPYFLEVNKRYFIHISPVNNFQSAENISSAYWWMYR